MSTAPLRDALEGALPERPFRVELWDGTELPSANGGPTFSLRSPQALGHVLRSPGQLGVGRAYVSGALDVDDVEAALQLLDTWKPPAIETKDESRNLLWLAIPSFGESWHNNHHAFPTSAEHGMRRWQIDTSALVIRTLERMGLAWDVVRISPEKQATRAAS